MAQIQSILRVFIVLVSALFIFGCENPTESSTSTEKPVVLRTHLLANPKTLNPQCHASQSANQIVKLMYQSLLELDVYTGELIPVLADTLPTIESREKGQFAYNYQIRKEAKWDDGTPITAEDIEFSLKVMFNPHCNNGPRRAYLNKICALERDKRDAKRFKIVFAEPFIQAQWAMVDLNIIPAKVFDPHNVYRSYSLEKVIEYMHNVNRAEDPVLVDFAKQFNSPEYQIEPKNLIGSGAYELKDWQTNQFLTLRKKRNWWGEDLVNENHAFHSRSNEIRLEIIKDWNLAIAALKNQQLDLINSVPMDDYMQLKSNADLNELFDFHTPSNFIYEYIGLNCKKKPFIAKGARKLLSQVVNKDLMVEKILMGKGEVIHSLIHPSKSYYDTSLVHEYVPEKAKENWKQLMGPNPIRILVNAGNKRREKVANLLVAEIVKAGGSAKIDSWDWKTYLSKRKDGDYDLIIGANGGSPAPEILTGSWHSKSIEKGRNFCGFGNSDLDQIIESIEMEMNTSKRNTLYIDFQRKIHENKPIVYLYTLNQRIIVNKAFNKAPITAIRPNYWLGDF